MPEKLPKGWVKTTLGEVCLPVTNARPEDSPSAEFTYFDIGGIDNETNRIVETKSITGRHAPSRARQILQKDDILFSTVRTYLRKIARLERDYPNPIASTGFTVLRAAAGVSSQFLFFQVLSNGFLQPIHALQSGSSYPAVRARDVLAQPLFLPPIREQERIVSKLNAALLAVQRAETAATRALQGLLRYRFAVLHDAIDGKLTSDWRKAHPNHYDTQAKARRAPLGRSLKHKGPIVSNAVNLPKLPAGWTWSSPEQLAKLDDNAICAGPFGTIFKARDFRPKGVPIIFLRNVAEGRYLTKDPRFMDKRKWQQHFKPYSVYGGELLITKLGEPPGVCAIYPEGFGAAMVTPDVIKFSVNESVASPRFLMHYFNSDQARQFFTGVAFGTTRQRLTLQIFREMPVPLPSLSEQTRIVAEVERRLAAGERLRTTLERQLARARDTRELLLGQAFAGTLVPQDPNDEPASTLLGRILEEKRLAHAQQLKIRRAFPITRRSDLMQSQLLPSPKSLIAAWQGIGRKPDARRLFEEAGFSPDQVIQFYEVLRATPELRTAFQKAALKSGQRKKPSTPAEDPAARPSGRFRLIMLWLEDFKNLKDYTIQFNPAEGLDVVLGWNGTGKSNLFEALVILFRDLYEWWEKNRWPEKPMSSFRLVYEINEQVIEVTWRLGEMKRPELRGGPRTLTAEDGLTPIKREQLPLPRFVFGYYSGPTNRLAEHFLPMKQAHYVRLREAKSDDPLTLAQLLEQRRFFCAETHHAKYVLLAFSYKEDPKIQEFLANRLRIIGFESALFIIRKPRWAKSGSKAEVFWGATGIMRRVMERLRQYAIAPMVLQQTVSYGYRSTTEDHYYFFLPDLESLQAFAAEYQDARTFFLALESTDFSELIHDVKIQVRIRSTNTEQVPITFHQLSEGEQQLLMVLGLMRFTKSHQSLVLLDEPDTHLNPHWSVEYLKDLTRVMSDNAAESSEQQTSQILIATHDPLVIASLVKEQIHLLKRDTETGACKWESASVNPRGLGFTGILTSEMFGFRSDLDPETLADLDNRVRLIAKEGTMSTHEKEELESIDKRLVDAGFSKAFSDPYYAAFVRAWGRRYNELMAGQQFVTPEKQQEIDRIATEVLKEAVAQVEKEVQG